MSGTSMDGIDAALLVTDGEGYIRTGGFSGSPYPEALRRTLLRLPAPDVDTADIERQVTDLQAQAVRNLCTMEGLPLNAIDLVGFHGQTILHEPDKGRTWQLGDRQRLDIHGPRHRNPAALVVVDAAAGPHPVIDEGIARTAITGIELIPVDEGAV